MTVDVLGVLVDRAVSDIQDMQEGMYDSGRQLPDGAIRCVCAKLARASAQVVCDAMTVTGGEKIAHKVASKL